MSYLLSFLKEIWTSRLSDDKKLSESYFAHHWHRLRTRKILLLPALIFKSSQGFWAHLVGKSSDIEIGLFPAGNNNLWMCFIAMLLFSLLDCFNLNEFLIFNGTLSSQCECIWTCGICTSLFVVADICSWKSTLKILWG